MLKFRARPVLIVAMAATMAVVPAIAMAGQATGGTKALTSEPAPARIVIADQDAEHTRSEFMKLLHKQPPSVSRVLKLDPTLLTNQSFLTPYPQVAAFVTQHPEVVRNPSYFLEQVEGVTEVVRDQWTAGDRMFNQLLDGIGFVIIFGSLVSVFVWLIKSFIDYRRWNRLARVQADAHTKLLDRFTANDELIAYLRSDAGSQFLQSAPIALDPGARRIGAPHARILWSVQAGIILLALGIGMQYVSGRMPADAQQAMASLGIIGIAAGLGFMVSSAAAYLLSLRLGLFEDKSATPVRIKDTPTGA